MNDDTARFVENMGSCFAEMGMPRAGGQILALLLITPGDGLTAAELIDRLSVSSGSVSTMTRLLVHGGMMEKFRLPGERRDRYRLRKDALIRTMEQKIRDTAVMRALMEEGVRVTSEPEARARVQDMADFYGFFEREMPKLIDKWRSER